MPVSRKTLVVGQMKLTNDTHVLRQRASHIDKCSVAFYIIYVNPTKTIFYYKEVLVQEIHIETIVSEILYVHPHKSTKK